MEAQRHDGSGHIHHSRCNQKRGHLMGGWRQQTHDYQHKEAAADRGVAGNKSLRKEELGMLKNDQGAGMGQQG